MTAEMKLVKLALRRDDSYPVGVSAPLHCQCKCSEKIAITGDRNVCPGCQLVVNGGGWIQEAK